jgi:hypothetical protein
VDLPVTLEELALGGPKAVAHIRTVHRDGGEPRAEARQLRVDIEPGMADGAAFVFEG